MPRGTDAVRTVLPHDFHWSLFLAAPVLMAVPAVRLFWQSAAPAAGASNVLVARSGQGQSCGDWRFAIRLRRLAEPTEFHMSPARCRESLDSRFVPAPNTDTTRFHDPEPLTKWFVFDERERG